MDAKKFGVLWYYGEMSAQILKLLYAKMKGLFVLFFL